MDKMKIAVTGAAGRMGRELVRTVHGRQDCVVAGAIEQEGSIALGQDVGLLAGLGKLGVAITDDPLEVFAKVDAVLDFTVPKATVEFAGLAANARIVHVLGTTGLSADDDAKIKAAARHATIVTAGNMSLGVNLLTAITQQGGRGARCRLRHRDRRDAPPPQGRCAVRHRADAGPAAAEGRGVDLDKVSARGRDGHTGERRRGDIGFASLRGGSVVGEHSVIFAADGEIVEITHRAFDRGIFARGAVKAALWGRGKGPGLYSMMDVLGIESGKPK